MSTCRTRVAILLATVGLALFASPVVAQPSAGAEAFTRFQGGIGGLGGTPAGEFADHVEGAGGVLGHFDVGLGRTVFSLGGEVAWLLYGSETREVPVDALIPDIPGTLAKIDTENQMLLVHARLRAQHRGRRWQPYADGVVGLTNLFTTTSIRGFQTCLSPFSVTCSSTSPASTTNSRDIVPSYGGGAGLMIAFKSPRGARLDVSMRYLRGGDARYLTEGAIEREAGRATLNFSRSRTDMLTLYIGVAFGR